MFDRFKKQQPTALGRVGRVEREQRMVKTVRYATIAIISIVIIVTIGGIVYNSLILPSQPVATVNGEEILTDDFQTRVKIERSNLLTQYQQILNAYYYAEDATTQSTYESYLMQLQSALEVETAGQSVMTQMIEETVLIQYAKEQGIEVTEDEVTEALYEIFGYYPDGAPAPTEAVEAQPEPTLSDEQLELITPTPAPTEAEGEEEAVPTQVTLDLSETASVTKEEYDEAINTYLDSIKEFGGTEETLRQFMRIQIYTEKLQDLVAKDIDPQQEQVWARHILVEDEETALDLLDQLEDGGDFGDLARTYSTDTGSGAYGGDLRWFGRGTMVTEFEEAAFDAEVGEIVGPVQTDFGYHIIQVLGHDMRLISSSEIDSQTQTAFYELLDSLYLEADVEYNENWTKLIPDEPNEYDIETAF